MTHLHYSKTKGDYQSRYDVISELYKDVKDANIENELTAELVGDYLFTDAEFVNRLSTENRNLFQKMYDAVKRLCKYATAGSKEARQLEKVKNVFENAYRDTKKATVDGGTKYSLVSIDGKYYEPSYDTIIAEHPEITVTTVENAKYRPGEKMSNSDYAEYRKTQSAEAKKKFGIYTNKDTSYSNEYGQINAEFGTAALRKGKYYGGIAYFDVLPQIGEIFENAVVIKTKPDSENDPHIKGVVDLVGCADIGNGNVAIVKLNVKEYTNNETKIYDNRVIEIEELTVIGRENHKSDSTSPTVSSEYIIDAYRNFVNSQNSLSAENSSAKFDKGWNIYGDDVRFTEKTVLDDDLPIGKNIKKNTKKNTSKVLDDDTPIHESFKNTEAEGKTSEQKGKDNMAKIILVY